MGSLAVQSEPVELSEFVEKELTAFAPGVAEKNITFRTDFVEGAPPYSADVKLLSIIIQNIVSNAVRYSKPNGTISVSLAYHNNQQYSLTVSDDGIGIPNDAKGSVFKKMFRADNARTSQAEGSGLGLYLVKLILDQIGGSIEFSSVEGSGASFTVHFPIGGMKRQQGIGAVASASRTDVV
jgi:two-component system phosphate regulon sensor histidine kinase PhoR